MTDYIKYKLIKFGLLCLAAFIYGAISSVRRAREAARRRRAGEDY
jgi:hypothetical protein